MLSQFLLPAFLAVQLACLAQTTYTYDSGGRPTKIAYGASGSIVYSFDAAGPSPR
jgi:hypothetical protein